MRVPVRSARDENSSHVKEQIGDGRRMTIAAMSAFAYDLNHVCRVVASVTLRASHCWKCHAHADISDLYRILYRSRQEA